jgi:membrane protease YdiL (CAAX protease family)
MIDSGGRSKYANPEMARTGFYFMAPLAAGVALLTIPSIPILSVVFAAFTVVLFFAGHGSNAQSVTGRWNWLDVLTVLALLGLAEVYGDVFTVLGSSPVARSAENILVYACAYAGLIFVVSVRRGARPAALGWRLPAPGWYLAVPVAVVLATVASNFAVTLEFHTSAFHAASQTQCTDTQSAYGTNLWGFIVALPLVSLAAPIVEESLFRGFLYRWMANLVPPDSSWRSAGIAVAMLASALVFGAFHATYGALYILPLATVGLILAALYQWSGSLLPGILTHAIFNAWGLVEILLTKTQC